MRKYPSSAIWVSRIFSVVVSHRIHGSWPSAGGVSGLFSVAPFSFNVLRDSYVFEINLEYFLVSLGLSGIFLRASSAFLAIVCASKHPGLCFSVE